MVDFLFVAARATPCIQTEHVRMESKLDHGFLAVTSIAR
jgi:hypothetical protein